MKTTLSLLAAGAVASAAALSHAGPAAAQADACKVYVQTAVKLAQDNVTKKCGFSGPEWSTDAGAQLKWCMGVNADKWRGELPKRQAMLAESCKPAGAAPAKK